MQHDTAGDPVTGLKWTRRTTAKIATELKTLGIQVSDRTVAKLLKQMGFALRVNHKKLCNISHEDRDAQFNLIADLRDEFVRYHRPLISIDTKEKELVGRFKNGGAAWNAKAVLVSDHDFRSEANGIAIPYFQRLNLASRT
jgi:arginine repressor